MPLLTPVLIFSNLTISLIQCLRKKREKKEKERKEREQGWMGAGKVGEERGMERENERRVDRKLSEGSYWISPEKL